MQNYATTTSLLNLQPIILDTMHRLTLTFFIVIVQHIYLSGRWSIIILVFFFCSRSTKTPLGNPNSSHFQFLFQDPQASYGIPSYTSYIEEPPKPKKKEKIPCGGYGYPNRRSFGMWSFWWLWHDEFNDDCWDQECLFRNKGTQGIWVHFTLSYEIFCMSNVSYKWTLKWWVAAGSVEVQGYQKSSKRG